MGCFHIVLACLLLIVLLQIILLLVFGFDVCLCCVLCWLLGWLLVSFVLCVLLIVDVFYCHLGFGCFVALVGGCLRL